MKLKGCEVTVQVKTVGGEHNCSHGVPCAAEVEFYDGVRYIPVDSILEPGGALFNFSFSEED